MKVLFVCLGNICRSPLAEAIFTEKVRQLKLTHLFQSDSCGSSNYNIGDDPDPRTIRSASKNKMPISHRARQLSKIDLESFDLILTMDNNNYQNVLHIAHPSLHVKVKLVRNYDPAGEGEVPDPYNGNEKDFDEVFEILDRSIESLIKDLTKEN
jgi:protein-tyrosine phosphatase